MPYNTTPIRPRKEVTGQVQLPCKSPAPPSSHSQIMMRLTRSHSVSRVKKIIAVDPDISICSNNAAFTITVATVRVHLMVHYSWPAHRTDLAR